MALPGGMDLRRPQAGTDLDRAAGEGGPVHLVE